MPCLPAPPLQSSRDEPYVVVKAAAWPARVLRPPGWLGRTLCPPDPAAALAPRQGTPGWPRPALVLSRLGTPGQETRPWPFFSPGTLAPGEPATYAEIRHQGCPWGGIPIAPLPGPLPPEAGPKPRAPAPSRLGQLTSSARCGLLTSVIQPPPRRPIQPPRAVHSALAGGPLSTSCQPLWHPGCSWAAAWRVRADPP